MFILYVYFSMNLMLILDAQLRALFQTSRSNNIGIR